ncbi:MAG: S8 family serine peptidase [Anaerolineae bacterium]|nr:S8 family serine peptidase [Anaerolineae bacterium]
MAVNKINSELQTQMNTLANQEPIPIIVRHKKGIFSAQAVLPSSPPIEQKFNLFPGEALKVTSADIEILRQQEDVEQIWPDLPVHTWLNVSVPKVEAPKVWTAGFKGTGIKVAVVDTGIDETHADVAGRVMASKSFVGDSTRDDNGHGTHVASTIAGNGSKSDGKYMGVAPEAHLYIAKVLRADGSGSMSSVMAGIEWAVLEQKVQVINLSLGGSGSCDGTDALSTLCDEAVLQGDVVMCVAAGNSGPGSQTIGPPGCARYVITVGAVDDNDRIARFSSRGPTADGRVKPDIVFPGVGIVAAQAAGTRLGVVIEEGYVSSDGTSMATPHASGVAALLRQARPELTAEQVKTQMLAGAINIGALPNEQGAGRGDAYRAYLKVIGEELPEPPPPPEPIPTEPPGCLATLFGQRK